MESCLGTDVVIIGAGPTGLTLAIALTYEGYNVKIVEKHAGSLPFSRAMFINSETLKLLHKFGLTEKFRESGKLVNGIGLYCGDKAISAVQFEHALLGNPFHPVTMPQVQIEKILENHLYSLGVSVIREASYNNHWQDSGYIIVNIQDRKSGEMCKMQTKYLFGADGFNSPVRQAIGVTFPGRTMEEEMIAVDITTDRWPYPYDISFILGNDGVGYMIAMKLTDQKIRLAASHSSLRSQLLSLVDNPQVDWISNFKVHHYHATAHGKDFVQLAGDAVHVHSPIGGRGMNMGIADAIALAAAVKNNSFEQYHQERSAVTEMWVHENKYVSWIATRQSFWARACRVVANRLLLWAGYFMGPALAKMGFQLMSGVKLS